jgi:transposase InsO family protein
MSSQYKYIHKELEKAGGSKAKKYINLTKKGNEFFIGDKKVIPVEDHPEFLKGFYDNPETGFQGRDRMFAKIAQDCVEISRRDIAKFLSNLETHQIHQEAVDVKISCSVVLRKEGTWAIDLTWLKEVDVESLTTVEKESQVVLTIVDCFSKYAWARILPNKRAKTLSDAFRKILAGEHCSVIRSDNGSEFKSNEFKAVTTEFEIKHIFSDTYNPRQNAMIERFNKTLKMAVYRYMTQWNLTKINNKDLQKIVTNYNNTLHTTTHQIPAKIHARDNPTAIKNARSEIKARAVKLLAENNRKFPKLHIGDTVRVARRTIGEWRKAHTFKKYSYMKIWMYELFHIATITRPTKTKASLYQLLGPDDKLINCWFLRQDLLKIDPKNLMKELEDTEMFVVEKVLDKELLPEGKVKYLVKWYGYSDNDNSWESPQESFQKAITEYEAEQSLKPKLQDVPVAPVKKVMPKTPVKLPVKQTRSGRAVKTPTRYK